MLKNSKILVVINIAFLYKSGNFLPLNENTKEEEALVTLQQDGLAKYFLMKKWWVQLQPWHTQGQLDARQNGHNSQRLIELL